MKRWRRELIPAAALAAFMAACRFIPGFARLWTSHIALPALSRLHGATASLPFPLMEPAAVILLILLSQYLASVSPSLRIPVLRLLSVQPGSSGSWIVAIESAFAAYLLAFSIRTGRGI